MAPTVYLETSIISYPVARPSRDLVTAAHQQLTLNGQCGYTDAQGRLNPKYASADQRIKELARIGEAAIAQVHTH